MYFLTGFGILCFISVCCGFPGFPCPSKYDIGCYDEQTPCPADRPHQVMTYHHVRGLRCPGCSRCIILTEECASLSCPLYYVPPGCIPSFYRLYYDIGDLTCKACNYLKCS